MILFYIFLLTASIVPICTYCGHELLMNIIRGKYNTDALKIYLKEIEDTSWGYIAYGIVLFSGFIASSLGVMDDKQQLIHLILLSVSFTVFILRSDLLRYIAGMYRNGNVIAHCTATLKCTLVLRYVNIALHISCIIYCVKSQL